MIEGSCVIRLCETQDTERIVPLIEAQIAATGRPVPDSDALAEVVHALLFSQFSDFLLAELDGCPLGVLQINYRLATWDAAPYAVIEDFYLDPQLRVRGVGTRMLDYACARAAARGSQFIQSSVSPNNTAARRLYQHFGFLATNQELWRRDLPLDCSKDEEGLGA